MAIIYFFIFDLKMFLSIGAMFFFKVLTVLLIAKRVAILKILTSEVSIVHAVGRVIIVGTRSIALSYHIAALSTTRVGL